MLFSLFLNRNISCGYLFEGSLRDPSNENHSKSFREEIKKILPFFLSV